MSNVDLSYLEEITGGDNVMMIEMIDLFLDETPIHIRKLKEFQEQEQWIELGAEAHKLKPTLLYVGLKRLNEKALKLEKIGKEKQNTEAVPELIRELEEGFEQASTELKSIKEELQ